MTDPTSAPTGAAAEPQRPAPRPRLWATGWLPGRRGLIVGALVLLVLVGLTIDVTRRLLDVAGDLRQANAAAQRSRATLAPLLQFNAESWPNRAG